MYYRQVPCLYNGRCDYKPAFHEVIQHYEDRHSHLRKEIPVQDLSKIDTDTLYGFRGLSKCTYNNQTFVFCHKRSDNVDYKWVCLLGSPNEAKHYSYALKLIGKETKNYFEGKVAAIDESFKTLFKAGKCFAIPNELFEAQFVDEEDYTYVYLLEIRNLKEKVKDENYESGISDNDEDSKK